MWVFDTMSGATPTGALPLIIQPNNDQTDVAPVVITSASGQQTTINRRSNIAMEIISLAEFEDDRIGLNAEWQRDYGRKLRIAYGLSYSDENDYTSTGLSLNFEMDGEQKLATYTLGVAYTSDEISRVDTDLRAPLSSVQDTLFTGTQDDRTTVDLILGYVRVLNRSTLLQLNTSFSNSDGYHTDPL